MVKIGSVASQEISFSPYLFVDTGSPVQAIDNSQLYLHFPSQFHFLRVSEQLMQIHARIQEHMEHTKGQIPGAGFIRRYFFVFDRDVALEINPAGRIVATHEDFDLSRLNNSLKRPQNEMEQMHD